MEIFYFISTQITTLHKEIREYYIPMQHTEQSEYERVAF